MSELCNKIRNLVEEIECEYGAANAFPATLHLSRAYDALKKLEADHAADPQPVAHT